ncbi:hypothetical protein [Algibacter sp. L3A6]|uniref:hypothetical protein n=1 Tax=Algibacter sp. L3A6 TaxID=2686366 RepID=UPI00131DD7A2|nr:hypothetical protein [Algibacter sp. L3A6]
MLDNKSPFFDIDLEDLLDFKKVNDFYNNFINCDCRNRKELESTKDELFDIEYKYIYLVSIPESVEDGLVINQELKVKTKKMNFFDDCLIPAILKIKAKEIGNIEIRRKAEKKYSNDEKLGFYNEVVDEYIEKANKIEKINYSNERINDVILNDVIWEIRDYIADRTLELESFEKIPFGNMTTENLAFLFSRLIENKYINLAPANLAKLISNYFLIKSKPIDKSFRNKLNYYAKKSNWTDKNIDNLDSILNKLKAIKK